jgi:plastocyanin
MTSRPPAATRTRLTSAVSALALPAVLIALAGCGRSSSSNYSSASTPAATTSSTPATPATTPSTTAPAAGGATSAQTLSLAANSEGQLAYEPSSLTAKAGKVSIDFTNMSPLGHNVTVASASGTVVGALPTFQGASKTLTLDLKPGTYKFYCTVPGHRQAGMEGTLVVK